MVTHLIGGGSGGALGGLLLLTVGARMRRVTQEMADCCVSGSRASVCPENAVTYSAGNGGQNICGGSLKPLRCRDPTLPPLKAIQSRPFPAEGTHAHYALMVRTRRRGFCTLVHPIYFVQP